MGCSASKLDEEAAVKLCRDRRNFIKQAVEHRTRFASGHIAYLESLRRVSLALRNFVDGEGQQRDYLLDSFSTPPFTPEKKLSPEIVGIPLKSLPPAPNRSEKTTVHVMRYLRSNANATVSVEEWPQTAETGRADSYYPPDHYGMDGFFAAEPPPMNPSFFPPPYYSRPNYPPQSPQNSQYDFFWNPFSSLDTYGYPSRMTSDDELARLRQVREEEGIPELEEVEEEENGEEEEEKENDDDCDEDDDHECECDDFIDAEMKDERSKIGSDPQKASVSNLEVPETSTKTDTVQEMKGLQSRGIRSIEVSKENKAVQVEVTKTQEMVGSKEAAGETPGFTVYMNRRFTSMGEVVKEIEDQFVRICNCANEVSTILEASRAHYSSTSRELAAIRALNPVSLFHSASSRSLSSRSFRACSETRGDVCESSSDYSEESCMVSESHHSTLDRLYMWEKKLYEEVKSGERIRVAYEKKCTQLRNLDVIGDEPSAVFKIRAAARDLHTRMKVSIHSVESISKRIETLRDDELQPQLMELIQRLARMWRTMGECHRMQKRAIDEAKRLPLNGPTAIIPKRNDASSSPTKPPRCAANLESELCGWRSAFATWVASQRSYARSLAAWAQRCTASGADANASAISMVELCSQWSLLVESLSEAQVVDGLDFFAAGIASVYRVGRERGEEDPLLMTAEKTAELAGRVLCAGMSVATGSLTDFATKFADGYDNMIINKCSEGDGGKEERVQM
ncbi:uncharacterized protein M6B38_405055 [Iris pallida]|uniref:Uncharacterized protein n=1 Tax=Iris pallida TaxID=29817 RepID=A0AAX6FRI0_IRIPA|nr:uncharacterized protein M6B38_405055 [Iris pallida]